MKHVPIPTKWKQYNVKSYLATPIHLKYIHIVCITVTLIIFTIFMIYFTSLTYDEVVEISAMKYSDFDKQYKCVSIGSRSADNFDFVVHSSDCKNNSNINYTFINYNPTDNYSYSYLTGLNFSSWRHQLAFNDFPLPLGWSTNDGQMNYSIDKGNAETSHKCKTNLFNELCDKYTNNNNLNIHFWYDIITVINVSKYKHKLQWYYNNTPYIDSPNDQLQLYYYSEQTETIGYSYEWKLSLPPNIPELYTQYNCKFCVPCVYGEIWYWSLTDGGSISSVWDLCQARFIDIGNRSVWMGWRNTIYYNNKTVFKIDPYTMIECWYNDSVYGLIKTDYYDSYGQNHIIPTPSNKTGILLEIGSNLFNYSDALTTISNGYMSYVRLNDKNANIITTNDALEIWTDICQGLINGYCDWIDVPPYFCKKNIHKTLMESISLSLSPTTTVYSILLVSFLFIIKCKSFANKINMDQSSVNLVLH